MFSLPDDFASCYSFGCSSHLSYCHILRISRLTSDVELTHVVACSYRSSFPDRIGCKSWFAYLDSLFFKHSIVRVALAHSEWGHTRAHTGRYSSVPINTLGQGSLVLERFSLLRMCTLSSQVVHCDGSYQVSRAYNIFPSTSWSSPESFDSNMRSRLSLVDFGWFIFLGHVAWLMQ